MGSQFIEPNPWMSAPFGLLLAAIALGPLLCPAWWSRHYAKVAWGLGALTAGYYLFGLRAGGRVLDVAHEYLSFIALIGSLYVVAGGIHLRVPAGAGPGTNTVFLLAGALASNLLGTTGAAMLLIGPWIRMNRPRVAGHHIVFFIFLVANVGGCLTPIGDPPLFLGYLRGVPFWWVAWRCWPMWLVAVGFLLSLFYVLDRRHYARAAGGVRAEPGEGWRVEGLGNLVWLVLIAGTVMLRHPVFLREVLMVAAAAVSYFTTPRELHQANQFDLHPLREVAVLFVGIFATMMPALDWLEIHAAQLGHPGPGLLYWSTGLLSSLLDNAPTYLSFLSVLLGLFTPAQSVPHDAPAAALVHQGSADLQLLAISLGAVFFGANTYIGNGPNFMIKAIADRHRVPTPGFLGFIFKYTLPCMVPMLVLVWWLFLRG